jgi:hypothetical protein
MPGGVSVRSLVTARRWDESHISVVTVVCDQSVSTPYGLSPSMARVGGLSRTAPTAPAEELS